MTDIHVENIVASFQLSQPITLDTLKKIFPEAKYKPEDASALIVHFTDPQAAAMLFATGKIIITGPKVMDDIKNIQKQLLQKIKTNDIPALTIHNIVATSQLNKKINLIKLAEKLPNARYKSAEFPGLSYQMTNPNTLILVFDSGTLVCNGTSMEDINKAITTMKEELSTLEDK